MENISGRKNSKFGFNFKLCNLCKVAQRDTQQFERSQLRMRFSGGPCLHLGCKSAFMLFIFVPQSRKRASVSRKKRAQIDYFEASVQKLPWGSCETFVHFVSCQEVRNASLTPATDPRGPSERKETSFREKVSQNFDCTSEQDTFQKRPKGISPLSHSSPHGTTERVHRLLLHLLEDVIYDQEAIASL